MDKDKRIVSTVIYPYKRWMPEKLKPPGDGSVMIARINDISAKASIHDILHAFEGYANKLYPYWYNVTIGNRQRKAMPDIPPENHYLKLEQYINTHPEINQLWFRKMEEYKIRGENIQLTKEFSDEIHLNQLELLTARRRKRLIIYINNKAIDVKRNFNGFARAIMWLLAHSTMKITVYIPDILKNHPDLISIMYNKRTISHSELVTGWQGKAEKTKTPKKKKKKQDIFENGNTKHLVNENEDVLEDVLEDEDWVADEVEYGDGKTHTGQGSRPFPDIIGAPHPRSPAELKLYDYIQGDPVLRDLFTFNSPLTTKDGTNIIADLLWEEGKLVVEVDSYRYHAKNPAFGDDRHRDYLLMITDYRVLRLTYDEIIHSVDKVGK
ncbi:MAG: endonuclease domain-containing protein, partial [Deltaproteobacteria bacterium]|nr:endonuclease domain-containing protein [Deltaproteobacteria bacterium]